ncbi:tyrosine-type recombinase/integrase [Priestia megaterium]|uniref:Tyrosine-type recombinase/integrase n=1 Tax=Priestia megaterium TaxID=1404 RepID=A0A6M6E3Y5_PRIMG|nr:tyrosine-type recombinase/integrase [Priestia megaterium]QJX80396.1 tyrosine-type recombinase/integrase [Priestia megaterium]
MKTEGRQFVHPIRDRKKIAKMKEYLMNQSHFRYFLFVFGINTGINIKELCALKVKDVRNKMEFSIAEGRNKRIRIISISQSLKNEIDNYIRFMDDEEFLFASKKLLKPITRNYAWQIIKEAAQACGVKEQVGSQTMRKTFAYHQYMNNKDILRLKQILGYSDTRKALTYIGIDEETISKSIRKKSHGLKD